jgi:Fe-S-cluster containining protein
MKFTREKRTYIIPDDETRTILFGIINSYEEFVRDIERRVKELTNFYGDDITCHTTCDSCCLTDRMVSRLEAFILRQGLEVMEPSLVGKLAERRSLKNKPADECPLLAESLCALYHYRPFVCRVQGLPLVSTEEDDYTLEVCPLNFQRSPEKMVLDLTHVVSIDRLAEELNRIDREFITKILDEKWVPGVRVSVTSLIEDFLSERERARDGEKDAQR